MRLLTHNFLQCHVKNCNRDNFPLQISEAKLGKIEAEYNKELVKKLLNRVDWAALKDATLSLGIQCLPEEMPEEIDDQILELLHEILFEVNIEDGSMKCRGCKHIYVIKDGIPNMLLQEHEV